ncbi:MAG: hypothetical protein ABSF33_06505 [Acidimicrobiales bacterium]
MISPWPTTVACTSASAAASAGASDCGSDSWELERRRPIEGV